MAEDRVWMITGAGRGLGRAFAEEALAGGDRVAVTARSRDDLDDLVRAHGDAVFASALDVTDRRQAFEAVDRAVENFGRIDVLVNNAGYGLFGAVEEIDEGSVRRQFDVNVFGVLWCTQAVLPHMRQQRAGHIFQISSVGGVIARQGTGAYCASKWAVEAFGESLALETSAFGIRVTLVELGPFSSDWNGTSMDRAEPLAAYDEILAHRRDELSGAHAFTQPGDPARAARALRLVLESDDPPLRLLLGNGAANIAPETYRSRLAEWARWDAVARDADYDGPALGGPLGRRDAERPA